MNFIDNHINPITRKRYRRFKSIKRAYWSMWILTALYLASLAAEFICNDNPIFVRYENRCFFPVLRYYPDDVFTASGRQTRPDYKKINKLPQFAENADNYMLFPPVPYGPLESIDPQSLEKKNEVIVNFRPQPRVGTVKIRRDFSISRSVSAGYFFGVSDDALRNLNLQDHWRIPDPLLKAIEMRFQNIESKAVSVLSSNRSVVTLEADMSVSGFLPRKRPPKSIGITFREPVTKTEDSRKVIFDDTIRPEQPGDAIWMQLGKSNQLAIKDRVKDRFVEPVDSHRIEIGGANYEVTYQKNEIQWPYRPVPGHWLGIDNAGRDVLARVIYGLRISMTFGFILVVVSMVLGAVIGAVQGYYGGKIDIIAQRLIEIWSALPFLYIMILLGSIYGRSFVLLLFIYGIFNWIGISYYMRAEFLRLRKQSFVEAARGLGLPTYKIIFKHIFPNALVPIITFFPFSLVGAIGSLAALDYLGFGLPPPTPSWGELLAQAQQFRWAWWLIFYPSLSLFIVMLLGVFVGEGVRHAFDPRQYSKIE